MAVYLSLSGSPFYFRDLTSPSMNTPPPPSPPQVDLNKQDVVTVHQSSGKLSDPDCHFSVEAVANGDVIVRVSLKGMCLHT